MAYTLYLITITLYYFQLVNIIYLICRKNMEVIKMFDPVHTNKKYLINGIIVSVLYGYIL